jgi:1-acyl-sn-glycerol-3-phosphate acyltransferase
MTSLSSQTKPAELPSPLHPNWLWWAFRIVLRIAFAVWLRYRAHGFERLENGQGGLLLINHQSFLDPLLAGLPLQRPVSYLARDNLFRVPVIGWLLRNTYVMPINRDTASPGSIKEAVRRMQHGFLVGIFPEGTRSDGGEVAPLKPGFIALVRRTKLPVYPIGIAGANDALPRKARFLRPCKVCVVFGEPFTPEEIEELVGRGQEERLLALAHERIMQCQREAEVWRREGRRPGIQSDTGGPTTGDQPAADRPTVDAENYSN